MMAISSYAKLLSEKLDRSFNSYRHIAPLATLRVAFGAIVLISLLRFMLKGWINAFYIAPTFHFTFEGFSWIHPLNASGMYALFALMTLAALCILLGLFYRLAVVIFFVSFTYVELIDKTFYLNHYYFISIFSFLLMLVPAGRYFSLDALRRPAIKVIQVPGWAINIFKLQLLLVYFYAGLSKLNYDWLFEAMPLKLWLPANAHLPVIGPLLAQEWVAYAFSWFGAVFDLCIGFLLLRSNTRAVAYAVVVLFHVFTAWFFKIGMFPYIMICVTIVFFSPGFHLKLINTFCALFGKQQNDISVSLPLRSPKIKVIYAVLSVYFIVQLLLPFRFLLYPGHLLWTEAGYRFSWRVMLMEKGGTAFFYVTDPKTGHRSEIINSKYLTHLQEKMMATQPDMIVQYAQHLAEAYKQQGIQQPVITTECYVTLNGSGSRLFMDSTVNLADKNSVEANNFVLPFKQNNIAP